MGGVDHTQSGKTFRQHRPEFSDEACVCKNHRLRRHSERRAVEPSVQIDEETRYGERRVENGADARVRDAHGALTA